MVEGAGRVRMVGRGGAEGGEVDKLGSPAEAGDKIKQTC